jgi:AraC-like DNA-binding protein
MATFHARLRSSPVEENIGESGIWAFESRHGESFSMAATSHRFPKLLLIREGVGQVEGDWGSVNCKMGDCVLVPPGLSHRIIDAPNAAISLYGLGIATGLFACVPEILSRLPAGVFSAEQLKSVMTEQRIRRILYLDGQSDAASRLACVAASLELFAEIAMALDQSKLVLHRRSKSPDSIDPLLFGYLAWIEHHFFEPVTLDSGASACGMSRRHFSSVFKRHVGKTWLQHLHHLRVNHAIELLRNTDRKITSVAFQCGFDDLTTFYRVVAKITGKRPSELRDSITETR